MAVQGASILIADDDADVRSVLSMFLTNQKHRVTEAADGIQAWERLQSVKPDLVVLDIMMPGMTGIEVCKRIREDKALQHTPVIMISALAEKKEILEGFRAGANDYVTKPFVNAEVLARVRSALRCWQLEQERDTFVQLQDLGNQLDRIVGEIEPSLVALLRNLRQVRDLTIPYQDESRSGQALYQHCMRAYMIVKELQNRKEEVKERLTRDLKR